MNNNLRGRVLSMLLIGGVSMGLVACLGGGDKTGGGQKDTSGEVMEKSDAGDKWKVPTGADPDY